MAYHIETTISRNYADLIAETRAGKKRSANITLGCLNRPLGPTKNSDAIAIAEHTKPQVVKGGTGLFRRTGYALVCTAPEKAL